MPLLNRRELRSIAIEALVVIFSVLAALWVDSWRDAQVERHAAAEAARGLNLEVARNLQEMRNMRSDVQHRVDRLAALGDSLSPDMPFARTGSYGGFRTPDLSRAAWQRASGDVIANRLDPAYLHDAFGIYNLDDLLTGLDDRISSLVFGETFYLPDRARAAWLIARAIMQQQLEWLDEGIPLHERFLEKYAPDLLHRPA